METVAPDNESPPTGGRLHRGIAASRRYGLLIYKMGMEVFSHFPGATIRILLAAGGSLACQVFALAVLYVYLSALENNAMLLGFLPRESLLLFAGIALLTQLLFIGFALLEYRANLAILSLCRHYQSLGVQDAIAVSSHLPHWFANDSDEHISARHMRQMLSIDIDHRSRMVRVLMLAIMPAARMLLCGAALLYLNPQFSLLILFAVGIPVIGLYSVGRRVADTVTSRESNSAPIFQQQWDLLRVSWKNETHLAPDELDWETTMGSADARVRQYFRRLRAKAYGTFLINTANAVGFMVLVMSLGFWLFMKQEGNWSLWLTYLVAVRYFLSSLSSVGQGVVASTRFMRQTKRFSSFMSAANLAVNSADPAAAMPPRDVVDAYSGDGGRVVSDDDLDED